VLTELLEFSLERDAAIFARFTIFVDTFFHKKGAAMRWYHYVAYFFGGVFLSNALPHLGNGISGHAFQSPFASPPGWVCPPQ